MHVKHCCQTSARAVQGFDTSDYTTQIGGEIKAFSGAGYIDKKAERRLDAVIKYAMVAGKKVCCAKIVTFWPRVTCKWVPGNKYTGRTWCSGWRWWPGVGGSISKCTRKFG